MLFDGLEETEEKWEKAKKVFMQRIRNLYKGRLLPADLWEIVSKNDNNPRVTIE